MTFRRAYVSQAAAPEGDLGANWRHNWETELIHNPNGNGSLLWIDENGGPWTFTPGPNGSFTSPAGLAASLTLSDHYELRKPSGVRLVFSAAVYPTDPPFGKLEELIDAHGESDTLSYDSNGLLQSVSNSFAGSIVFTRDDNGHIATATDTRDNLTFTYGYITAYSGGIMLNDVIDFNSVNVAEYAYNYSYYTNPNAASLSMLSSIWESANGQSTSITYYDNGQVYYLTDALGGIREFVYSGAGTATPSTQVIDVDNQLTNYVFNSQYLLTETDLPDGTKRTQTWNANNQLASSTDELGNTTYYNDYDSLGNPTQIVRPDGDVTYVIYDQTWDKPISLTPPAGALSIWQLNPSNGDVQHFSRTDPATGTTLTLSYTYDQYGGLLSTNNGLTTYANKRDQNGLLTYIFDLHNPQTLSYDLRGRVVTRSYQSGRVLNYSYDNYNRVIQITDTTGPTKIYSYDAAGRVIALQITDGSSSQQYLYTYDLIGRLTNVTQPLRATAISYDIYSGYTLTQETQQPTQISTQINYVNYNTITFTYDNRDRLSTRTDANGAATRYSYDAHGNLTSLTDADGNVNTFAYDVDNRLVRQNRPSVLNSLTTGLNSSIIDTTNYGYDAVDELISQSESTPTGQETALTQFTYDGFNRLIEKNQQFTPLYQPGFAFSRNDDSKFTYSPQLDATTLLTATNAVENLSFTYETAPPFAGTAYATQPNPMPSIGNDPSPNLPLIQDSYTITRDVTGNIAKLVNSKGVTIFTKLYDPAGRLTNLTGGAGYFSATNLPLHASITYDSFGRRATEVVGDPMTETVSYDLANQISEVKWVRGKKTVLMDEVLTRDPVGNITQIAKGPQVENFGYDPTNQLASANIPAVGTAPAYVDSYQYDGTGNRIQDTLGGPAQVQDNMFLQNNQTTVYWDFDGFGTALNFLDNATANIGIYYFRPDGKVASIQFAQPPSYIRGRRMYYYYDALGRRVAKQAYYLTEKGALDIKFTQTYGYLFDQDKILIGQAGDGSQTLYFDGLGIDEHLGQVNASSAKGYMTDYLGSVLNTVTGGPGHEFDPWGGLMGAKPGFSVSSAPVQYGFAGRQYDAETAYDSLVALEYDRGRSRHLGLGIFISPDPSGFKGGDLNLYRYARNNPLNFVDPYGTDARIVTQLGHIAVEVYQPGNPASTVSIGLGPTNSATLDQVLQGSVPGQVSITSGQLPLSFPIPGTTIVQGPAADAALIARALQLQSEFAQGNLLYDAAGFNTSGNATNCAGFAYGLLHP